MRPELKELLLAAALGVLAGPVYLLAGPSRFLPWYACVLAAGALFPAAWLREIKPGRRAFFTFLAWPFVAGACAALSLTVSQLAGRG